MTCLSIVRNVCKRIGIPAPNTATGSTDPTIIQMVALLNEEGQELAQRHEWSALTIQANFTTTGGQLQAYISDYPGFKYILNDTIWNRTLRRPVYGPLSAQRWQQLSAMSMQGPFNQYRIKTQNGVQELGPAIHFIPSPTANQSCYFEYVSEYWANNEVDGTSGTIGKEFTQDEGVSFLDEQLLELGLRWRWKAAKGMDYAEDYNTYERRVLDAIARDGGRDTLSFDGAKYDIYPGIVVPSGAWDV